MIKKTGFLLVLIAVTALFFENCASCDDCQVSPAPKQVHVVNNSGDDLIFGPNAVYDPNNIEIKNNLGETVEFFKNTSNGSIDFTFSVTADTYSVKLKPSETETVKFTYGKDKHIDCCSEFDVTSTTTVNGKLVSNNDKITIVK